MRIKRTLGFLGLLPFLLSLLYVNQPMLSTQIYGEQSFLIYSIAISSFLCGSLWQPNSENKYPAIVSNTLCVIAFLTLFASAVISAIGMLCVFILIWRAEKQFASAQTIERNQEYLLLRSQLTFVVASLHLVLIIFIVGK